MFTRPPFSYRLSPHPQTAQRLALATDTGRTLRHQQKAHGMTTPFSGIEIKISELRDLDRQWHGKKTGDEQALNSRAWGFISKATGIIKGYAAQEANHFITEAIDMPSVTRKKCKYWPNMFFFLHILCDHAKRLNIGLHYFYNNKKSPRQCVIKEPWKCNHTQPKLILRGGDTFMPFISPQSIERSHNAFIGW